MLGKETVTVRRAKLSRLRLRDIFRTILLFALCGVQTPLAQAPPSPTGGKRIALIIGNANYPDEGSPIPTASKDARLLAEELRRDEFDVELRENTAREDMRRSVDTFLAKVQPGSTAFLYFSGFGIQVARQSYLIPVDGQIWSEQEVRRDGFALDDILRQMGLKGARVKMAVVDASRRNPYERRFRAFSAGLATIDAPDGTLAIYAAAPGKVSSDRTGDTSLFMQELLKEIRIPGNTAEDAFNHTRLSVSRASNREQVPWVVSSLSDDFYFVKTGATPTLNPAQPQPSAANPVQPPPATSKPGQPAGTAVNPTPPQPSPNPPPGSSAALRPAPLTGAAAAAPTNPGDSFRDCPECPEMIAIPAGSFDMGAAATPFDRPVHRVTIAQPFSMSRNAITFDEWDRCVAASGCRFKPDDRGWGRGDHPVINVSWYDAKEYVAWLSQTTSRPYRLPSEAEWEYAARAGTKTPFYWGTQVGTRMANCRDCQSGAGVQTLSVGSFPPNGFGLNDMSGNAAQWLEDCWNESYRAAPQDGSAWSTGNCAMRVLRGGSFDNQSAYIKSAARFRYDADVRYFANGFRVARKLP